MASEIILSTPRTALNQLREILIPTQASPNASVALIITMDDTDLNLREMAAYLVVIDNGRLSRRGLASYVRVRRSQLHISSVRQGSVELVIQELSSHSTSLIALAVLRCFLKYLPGGLREIAAAYRDYEEGLMVRARRQELRHQIRQDEELSALDDKRKKEIAAFLDALYYQERRHLPAAKRFAELYVRRVILQLSDENDSQESK